jgi:hypothetical protein
VITNTENAIQHKGFSIGVFLDIEGAFDQTSFEATISAARMHGVEPALCRLINTMLGHKIMEDSHLEVL